MTVNHSLNFVDPVTGSHTNTVEGMWMHAKARSKRERGTSKNLLPSYLNELMWCQRKGSRSVTKHHQWNQRCLPTVVPEVRPCFKSPFIFIVFYFKLHAYISQENVADFTVFGQTAELLNREYKLLKVVYLNCFTANK